MNDRSTPPAEKAPADSAAGTPAFQKVLVRTRVTVFDLSLESTLVGYRIANDGRAPGVSAVRAKGVFRTRGDWRVSGIDLSDIRWWVPGHPNDPFGVDESLGCRAEPLQEDCALPVWFVRRRDGVASRARWAGADSAEGRGGEWQLDFIRWRGDATCLEALPDALIKAATEGADYLDESGRRPRYGAGWPALPFVLSDGDRLLLNPDALAGAVVWLDDASFEELTRLVTTGAAVIGDWSGMLVVGPAGAAFMAATDELSCRAPAAEAALVGLRWRYQRAQGVRAARLHWLPALPPAPPTAWGSYPLHRALMEGLESMITRAVSEDWTHSLWEERADQAMEFVKGLRFELVPPALEGKGGTLQPPRSAEGELLRLAQDANTRGEWDDSKLWPLFHLGFEDMAPWFYLQMRHLLTQDYEELERDYRRLAGFRSPAVERVLIHALLLSETTLFLGHLYWDWGNPDTRPESWTTPPDWTAIVLWGRSSRYRHAPVFGASEKARDRAIARSVFWHAAKWLVTLGGLLSGRWLPGRGRLQLPKQTRLLHAMQMAVRVAAARNAPATEVLAAMRRATTLGAAWSNSAWRLVRGGLREEGGAHRIGL